MRGRSEKSHVDYAPAAYTHDNKVGLYYCRMLQNLLIRFPSADRWYDRHTIREVFRDNRLKLLQCLLLLRLQTLVAARTLYHVK
jgi:hypothetical protein